MSWNIRTASQEWLVSLCQRVQKEKGIVGGLPDGKRVIKISDTIAVKIGYFVTAAEAATQKFAYENINPNVVRVPRVYRFFEDRSDPSWGRGYLFMEYISGKNLGDLDLDSHPEIVPQVANIIQHLGQIGGGQVPGPVGGGEPQGYLWGDDGTRTVFNSTTDMSHWLNKRLILRNKSIDLTSYPLVLCHMDLCRRNMILMEDGKSICLVDWGHAGLFPRFFELATLSCLNPYDEPYEKPLLEATEELIGLKEEEKDLMKLLQIARAASLRYIFETDNVRPGTPPGLFSYVPPPMPPQKDSK